MAPRGILIELRLAHAAKLRRAAGWYVLQMVATLVTPLTILALMQLLERSYEATTESGSQNQGNEQASGIVVLLVAASTTSFLASSRFSEAAACVGAEARLKLCSRAYRGALESVAGGAASIPAATAAFFVQSAAIAPLFEGLIALAIQPVEIMCILGVLVRIVGLLPSVAAISTAVIGLCVSGAAGVQIEKCEFGMASVAERRGQLLREVVTRYVLQLLKLAFS